ncbi:MAG: glycoside hydrolase family 44 protein [Gemmatimonadaceae bacterium]
MLRLQTAPSSGTIASHRTPPRNPTKARHTCVVATTAVLLAAFTGCTSENAKGSGADALLNPLFSARRLEATALVLASAPADTSNGYSVGSGKTLGTLTLGLRDASNRNVSRSGVAITARLVDMNGAAIIGATLSGPGPVNTDSKGSARFSALVPTANVGEARIVFSAAGLTPTSFHIRIVPGAVSAAQSTFVLSADTLSVGRTLTATVLPRDGAGNKIGAGLALTFTITNGTSGGTFSAPAFITTDSTYSSTFTATTSGTASLISATAGSVPLSTSRIVTVNGTTTTTGADYTFSINTSSAFPISRFIYGANAVDDGAYANATPPAELTFNRMGGNRLTAYNWENGYSNAGADYNYQNDRLLQPSSTAPGDAVRLRAQPSFNRGQAFMATIPMLGYVAGDACNCNVGITDADRATRLATHFKVSKAFKGAPFLAAPALTDGFVYQDEFVSWFGGAFPGRDTHPTAPVFFSLDNEPDIWHSTHKEIQTDLNDNSATPRLQTYAGLSDTSILYARAVKSVLPNAQVFGPAVATYTGITVLGRYPTPDPAYGTQNFFDVYLDRMRAAESTYGRRLLDVLDTHWYPAASYGGYEITNDYAPQDSATIEARVQAPRSLWDPTYTENSWVVQVTGGPVKLLPRLRAQIAAHYPGTKLAITEYYYGRGGDISGGIAQADVLGIFGREGVFAAALWPNAGVWAAPYAGDGNKAYAYVFGAFRMFLNYDGSGGRFGDTGLLATTNNVTGSSVYASRDGQGRIVIVAINKSRVAKKAAVTLSGTGGLTRASVWALTAASPSPVRQTDIAVANSSTLSYTMPALSVSTIVVSP